MTNNIKPSVEIYNSATGNMYIIRPFDNEKAAVGTVDQLRMNGTEIEVYNKFEANTSVYQWIIEPVLNKPDVFRIRMSYQDDRYLHVKGSISELSRIELYNYDSNYPNGFEWIITPVQGLNNEPYSFYIRNASNPNLYLHLVNSTSVLATRLELRSFNQQNANTYRWILYMTESRYDMDQDFASSIAGNFTIAPVNNTFLNLINQDANNWNSFKVLLNRPPVLPDPTYYWLFEKSIDGSYYIQTYSKFLHLENRKLTSGTNVEAYNRDNDSYNLPYYRWIVKQVSPYSKNYQISPAMNENLSMSSGEPTKMDNQVKINNNSALPKDVQWEIFPTNNPVNQAYSIKPGIYKIASVAAYGKYLTTEGFKASYSNLAIKEYNESRFSSFYWVLEYEKDANGNPVMDGTYIIRLFGSDDSYIHTRNSSVSDWANVETYKMDADKIATYKWYIIPSDKRNEYYIQIAGNNVLGLHLNGNNISNDTLIDLANINGTPLDYRLWQFEPVNNIVGTVSSDMYKIQFDAAKNQFVKPKNGSTSNGTSVEIYPEIKPKEEYQWLIERDIDNTYVIKKVGDLSKYIHPKDHSTSFGTILELLEYSIEYSRLYKWIIEEEGGSYIFKNVDNPSMWIHASSPLASTPLQLERWSSGNAKDFFYWILDRQS